MVHELHITYDDKTGAVSVKGAVISRPVIAYGMLHFAHDNINRLVEKSQQAIVPPSAAELAALIKKPNGA